MGIVNRLVRLAKAYMTVKTDQLEKAAQQVEVESDLKQVDSDLKKLDRTGRELGAVSSAYVASGTSTSISLASDYKLLGIPYNAELPVVEDAWRKLAQRADPKRFPAGSPEEKQAAEILNKINAAYARIREVKNPTEGRFGKLEL